MGKYIITHACGCKKEYNLYGKISDREEKAAYLESCECQECQNKRLLAETDESKFAELEGSEKQIAWARVIRAKEVKNSETAKFIKKIESFTDAQKEQLIKEYQKGSFESYGNPYMMRAAAAFCETQAKWWIDHR